MAKTHKQKSKNRQSGIPIYRAVIDLIEGDTFKKAALGSMLLLLRAAWACDVGGGRG